MKMNISTNEGNPNTLKLIIAAKVAQHAVTVKTVQPKGKIFNVSAPSNSISDHMMKYHMFVSLVGCFHHFKIH